MDSSSFLPPPPRHPKLSHLERKPLSPPRTSNPPALSLAPTPSFTLTGSSPIEPNHPAPTITDALTPKAEAAAEELDSDSSDSDDDYKELLARQIAGAPLPRTDSVISTATTTSKFSAGFKRLTKLRRRSGRPESASQSDDASVRSRTTPETAEEKVHRRLEEMEDIEISNFLMRVGKRVQEVKMNSNLERRSVVYPKQVDYVNPVTKRVDWIKFGSAYLLAAAEIHTPNSLVAEIPSDRVSLSLLKSQLERFYVVFPPSVIHDLLLENNIANVYRWKSPNTWKWALFYAVVVYFDIILLVPVAYLLYSLAVARLLPPSPQQMLQHLLDRQAAEQEVEVLSKDLDSGSGRFSFAKAMFKDKIGLRSKGASRGSGGGGGGALSKGLGETMRFAGGLASGSGLHDGHGHGTPDSIKEEYDSDDDDDLSLYRLAKSLLRSFGPILQEVVDQAIDIVEKLKNIFLHPTHPSVPQILIQLALVCVFLLFCPTWLLFKGIWMYLGVEFFVLFRLRENYPEYRKALNPIWWLLINAPTDAEFVTYILRKRAVNGKPLRGAKSVKRMNKDIRRRDRAEGAMEKAQRRDRSNSSRSSMELDGSRMDPGLPVPSTLRTRSPSISSVRSNLSSRSVESQRPSSFVSATQHSVPTEFFALYKSTPGTLRLTDDTLAFFPQKGFKSVGSGIAKLGKFLGGKKSDDDDSDTASIRSNISRSSQASRFEHDVSMCEIAIAEIIEISKNSSKLTMDGMTITVFGDDEYKFRSVEDRDDLFNRIVSLSPSNASS